MALETEVPRWTGWRPVRHFVYVDRPSTRYAVVWRRRQGGYWVTVPLPLVTAVS